MTRAGLLLLLVLFSIPALAQTPATVHAQWNPNPTTDLVTQYQLVLDGGTPLVVLPAVCAPTLCSQIVTVPTFGLHSLTLVACALKISTDPTSLVCSAPVVVPFTLGSVPVVVAGAKVVS